MSIRNLSVFIVGKDHSASINQCIQSCLTLSDRIYYVDLGSRDDSIEVAKSNGIFIYNGQSLINDFKPPDRSDESDWILFVKAGEKVSLESPTHLNDILINSQAEGYSLVIKAPVNRELIENFRWMKMPVGNNSFSSESFIVPRIETRMARQRHFAKVYQLIISESSGESFTFSSQLLHDLQIHSLEQPEEAQKSSATRPAKDLELEFLRGETSAEPEDDYGMWELGDSFISFTVLNSNDLSRYYRGLSLGFGNEGMYLTMLHNNLGKFGKFMEARDFFNAWREKWGKFDTPEPYKVGGIIYAHLFEFEEAESLFRHYLELSPEKYSGEVYSLLAKTLLLRGRKDEAVAYLEKSLCLRMDKFDRLLMSLISDDNWEPPKLTLCMIARDEQEYLAKALASVSGIVDEIIVADTGSKDDTAKIANDFGAIVIKCDWEDDFSKPRNSALLHATGDFVLWLDADEYIDVRERIKLALFKMILPPDRNIAFRTTIDTEDEDEEMSVMLRLPKVIQPDHPVRIYPLGKGIIYKGFAFESVNASLRDADITVADNEIFKITHSLADRKRRDLRKERAVQKTYSNSTNPVISMGAALYNLRMGNFQAALNWLGNAEVDNPRFWMKIITLYCRLGQAKQLSGIVKKVMMSSPDSLELALAKSELHFSEGDYESIYKTLNAHLENIDPQMAREDRAQASYLCGMALVETGNTGKGIELISDARELDSWNDRYKLGGFYALTIAEAWENAIQALSSILTDEKKSFVDVIHDFSDLAIIVNKLGKHYRMNDRFEAADLCQKVFMNIIENKLSDPEATKKIIHHLDSCN